MVYVLNAKNIVILKKKQMNELMIQAWIVTYMSDPFDIDKMNEVIDYLHSFSYLEQQRAIGLLRREYDALN